MQYLDFEIEVSAGEADGYNVRVLRSPAGEARGTLRLPFTGLALQNNLQALQIALLRAGTTRQGVEAPESRTVQIFGQELWRALFSGDILGRFETTHGEARRQNAGVRIKLRFETPELAALPWEYLFDADRGDYVTLSASSPVVRYIPLPEVMSPLLVEPPLRVLGMVVSPSDLPALDVDRERQRLDTGLADLTRRGLVELVWISGGTSRDLQQTLWKGPWHVFHFIGYGGFDAVRGEGVVVFLDSSGKAQHVSATDLGRLLGDHDPLRLAVLNASESARGDEGDVFSSTAATLVRRGTPAVVAMQFEIADDAAIEFSRSFYGAVANGIPVDAALAEARMGVALAVPGTLAWGTPVLYMRAPDGVLFDIPILTDLASTPRAAVPAAEAAIPADAAGAVIVCPNCGHANGADDQFCGSCGTFLEFAAVSLGAAAAAAPQAPMPSVDMSPPSPMRPPPSESWDGPRAPMRSRAGPGGIVVGAVAGVVGGVGAAAGAIAGGLSAGVRRVRGPRPIAVADPGPTPTPTPTPISVERPTSATFPAQVEAGAIATLVFSIGQILPESHRGSVSIDVAPGTRSVDLVATVHAPAFDVVSPAAPPGGGGPIVALPLDVLDPASAVRGEFVLRARPTDGSLETMILLDFWHLSSPVGQIRIATRVVTHEDATAVPSAIGPTAGAFRVSTTAPPSADITLFITDEGGGRYLIQATTPNVFMRDLGAFPAGENAWSYSATLLERFRDAADLPEAARVDRVEGLGLDLWNNLPKAFQDFYFTDLYGQDRSIAIYSQEPYIPWELIRPPTADGRTPGFLGTDFRVARWRNGRLFPDPLAVRDFVVVAPDYVDQPLEEAGVEAGDLVARFGARQVDGAYDHVAASLRSADIDVVHFAGHGAYDEAAPLQSRIWLSDQALLPTDVRTFRQGKARGPFVFLNACEVGEEGWVFTGIGGWADTFCDVGCAGFIGPYWAVGDEVAHQVALRFYGGLEAGLTVGEAIRDVRRAFDEPGPYTHDPTWLAYSLHCQPNIRIQLTH